MTKRVLLALFLLAVASGTTVVQAAEDLRRTWTLYHSVNPKLGAKGFTKRGVVTLEPSDDNQVQLTVVNDENSLTAKDIDSMMASGWYQVKLVEDKAQDGATPVMTTVPACQMRRSNFRYVFVFLLFVCPWIQWL